MNKISVIIPMYNSQDYIGQCLRSVISQTYRNLEVLVIDDGSTDKSVEICQSYCQKDKRIRLLLQEHGGVSVARNRGLDTAKGAYLFFLDSDDMIHPLLLEEMARHMGQSGTKLVFCKYMRLEEGRMGEVFHKLSAPLAKQDEGKWEAAEVGMGNSKFYKRHSGELLGIGGKLIEKERIGELRFDKSIKRGEDTFFLHELFSEKLWVGYFHHSWYYCRIRPDSLSHSSQIEGEHYIETYTRIRNIELERNWFDFALIWENTLFYLLKEDFTEARKKKEKKKCLSIKKRVIVEQKLSIYKRLPVITRLGIWSCFYCHPLYKLRIIPIYREVKRRIAIDRNIGK